MLVGSPGVATSSSVYANVLNQLAGTKFKIITGYVDVSALNLAMENNEIQGRAGWYVSSLLSTKRQWVEQGLVKVLVQMADEKHPAFPNVPLATEFVTDPAQARAARLLDELARRWGGRSSHRPRCPQTG